MPGKTRYCFVSVPSPEGPVVTDECLFFSNVSADSRELADKWEAEVRATIPDAVFAWADDPVRPLVA